MWRIQTLQALFLVLGFLVVIRLFYWQVVVGDKLKVMAESQHFAQYEIPALRGQILASDGFPLATNQQAYLLYAILPQLSISTTEVSSKLAPLLSSDVPAMEDSLNTRMQRANVVWVPLARKIDRLKKKQIEELSLSGIGFEEEQKRFYPEGSMSAHLLGLVGQDSAGREKGYFGLEGFYDKTLVGKTGFVKQEKDASGKPILIGESSVEGEVKGRDLQLYLDRGLQFMIEAKLKAGMEKFQAKGGLAIVMNPSDGAILAMSSFPNYDPSRFSDFDGELFSNPVISQVFEPGSIFKPVVMAAAINEGALKQDERCTKCDGPRQIGEYTIRTWNEQYHPDSSMTEILEHSDNVGMVYVGEKMGKEKLLSYLKDFGFDKETGIDLGGEAVPTFRGDNDWTTIDLATASFGQGVAVTPIQMVRAISAIANGGQLVEPHVVAKVKTMEKEIITKPKIQKRVISAETARIVTEMMVNAAERGGKWKRPEGYRVAGKTGTAQVPISGHYDKEKTIVSFVGFAPAENPRFVMLVTLREPALTWGSMTVAPLWFEIATEMFNYLKIPPHS